MALGVAILAQLQTPGGEIIFLGKHETKFELTQRNCVARPSSPICVLPGLAWL